MEKVTVTPPVFGSEISYINDVIINKDQDIIWSRDSRGNIIGYTIINPKEKTTPPDQNTFIGDVVETASNITPVGLDTVGDILEVFIEVASNIELEL